MLTCHCDSCGVFVPPETRATVQVRMGKTDFPRFDLCDHCQYAAVKFFEDLVGTEVLSVSREKWSEAERVEFQRTQMVEEAS